MSPSIYASRDEGRRVWGTAMINLQNNDDEDEMSHLPGCLHLNWPRGTFQFPLPMDDGLTMLGQRFRGDWSTVKLSWWNKSCFLTLCGVWFYYGDTCPRVPGASPARAVADPGSHYCPVSPGHRNGSNGSRDLQVNLQILRRRGFWTDCIRLPHREGRR